MLAKRYRLNKKKDIQYVLEKGKIYFSPVFNLKVLKNSLTNSRFCIIISTKISKKAVMRNRAKRQLSAILYNNLANISQNYDIIILTKSSVTITKYQELEKALIALFKKAKIYQN